MEEKEITISVTPETFEDIKEIEKIEDKDRSSVIQELLEKGIAKWKIETAINKYQEGEISFEKATQIAGVSPWYFQEILNKEKMQINYNKTDLIDDIEQINKI